MTFFDIPSGFSADEGSRSRSRGWRAAPFRVLCDDKPGGLAGVVDRGNARRSRAELTADEWNNAVGIRLAELQAVRRVLNSGAVFAELAEREAKRLAKEVADRIDAQLFASMLEGGPYDYKPGGIINEGMGFEPGRWPWRTLKP